MDRFDHLADKYYFSEEHYLEKVEFIQTFVTHTEGPLAEKPLTLAPFQKNDILKPAFGLFTDSSCKKRLIRKIYIEIPRGNAKTSLLAAVEIAMLFNDGQRNARIYNCAGDAEQAGILYETAKSMIEQSEELSKIAQTHRYQTEYNGSILKKMTSKPGSKHGQKPYCVTYDELHVADGRELYDTLVTGLGKIMNAQMWSITTAGYNKQSICWELHEYTEKVNKGILEDDNFWGVIYAAPAKADIYSPKVWEACNPLYKYSEPLRDAIADDAKTAQNDPSFENTFRRLRLNQWTASESKWIKSEKVKKVMKPLDINEFTGSQLFLGVDLSSTMDLTALSAIFEKDNKAYWLYYLWIPEEAAYHYIKKFNIRYDLWPEVTVVEGEMIDYSQIEDKIVELSDQFGVASVEFDPWNSIDLALRLQDNYGLQTNKNRQGYSLSYPLKQMASMISDGKLIIHESEAMKFMFDNCLVKTNDKLDIQVVKPKDFRKVDGVVSGAMALNGYLNREEEGEIYAGAV